MKDQISNIIKRYTIALSWAYFTILFSWLALYILSGDRFGYIGLANNFSVYLFYPLPLFGLVGVLTRRKELIGSAIFGTAVFIWFWGALFLPRLNNPVEDNPQSELSVMTYNVLGLHGFIDPVIDTILQENSDLVLLQELTPNLAQAMQTELAEQYPYQILDPQPGVSGLGTLSRYPLLETGERLPLEWVGIPQLLKLNFEGLEVTLVNFHTNAYTYFPASVVDQNLRHREAQAQALADFAAKTSGPLIIAGDANAGDISQPYKTIRSSGLQDSWRVAGFGFGGTFPGSTVPGSSRWRVADWYVPQWILRIDYIFISQHWGVRTARVAHFDGVSDHRAVLAELLIQEP